MYTMSPPRSITVDVKKTLNTNPYSTVLQYQQLLEKVAIQIQKELRKTKDRNTLLELQHITKRLRTYGELLEPWARKKFATLLYALNKDNEKQWLQIGQQIAQLTRQKLSTPNINTTLIRHLNENVRLIKSMPEQAAQRVEKLIYENTLSGTYRSSALIPEIMKIGDITRNRAGLIARTETAKINSDLVKIRSENMGVYWYVWRTSQDIRVRDTHRVMKDVLVKWDDPPAPEELLGEKSYGHYHAGQIFNCRCYSEPVIDIDDISWPHKVYRNGKIIMMRKLDFVNMNEQYKKAA